jgi:hypothetical protein
MYDYATAKVYLSYKRTSLLRRSYNYDGEKVLGLCEMCVHAVSTEKYELVWISSNVTLKRNLVPVEK